MRKKVYECANCGAEICIGDKYKWIEQRNICLDCSLKLRYKRFVEWDKDYPDIEATEKDIF